MAPKTSSENFDDFLEEKGLSSAKKFLKDEGITSLELLLKLCEDDAVKADILKAMRGDKTSTGIKLAAKALDKLTAEEITAYIAALDTAPKDGKGEDDPVDAALAQYLKKNDLSPCLPILQDQGVFTLRQLAKLLGKPKARDEVRKMIAEGCTIDGRKIRGSEFTAELFDDLKPADVEKAAQDAKVEEEKKSEAEIETDPDFEAYLKENDLAYYLPLFRSQGITSLRLLSATLSDAGERQAMHDLIAKGGSAGGKTYKGNAAAARLFDGLKDDDVRRQAEREAQRRKEGRDQEQSDKLSKAKAELEQAMREVEAVRAECAKAAKENRDAVVKEARERLDEVLKRANSKELLDGLKFGAGTSVEQLNRDLDKLQSGLSGKVLDNLKNLIDARPRTARELVDENGLLRGFYIDARGCNDIDGGDVLDMQVHRQKIGRSSTVRLICSSETHRGSAQRTVETASSAFSTAESAKGAAFIGSGIGAVSAAGSHARARQQMRDQAEAEKTGQATHVRLDYILDQQEKIDLESTGMRLSNEAIRSLQLLVESDEDERRERAQRFLRQFGSHVFLHVILGGWYCHAARAESNSKETFSSLDSALSEASNWAVSVAGSYVGLAGAGMIGSANQGDKSSARGNSSRLTYQTSNLSVEVTTSTLGGMSGLPIDHWHESVHHSSMWRPIDRDGAYGIWEVLKDCELPRELANHRRMLSKLFETVWIHDVFLPSIDKGADPKLKRLADRKFDDVAGLTRAVEDVTSGVSPRMRLTLFRKEVPASQHFHGELELPAGYKILSGGVEATGQTAGNLIVSSHPEIRDGKWVWRASMKDSRQKSEATHIISVIALWDEKNEWDVQIVRRKTGTKLPNQSQSIEAPPGYAITGGGIHIDPFEDTHVLGCGFGPAPGGDAMAPRAWTATSLHYTYAQLIEYQALFSHSLIPNVELHHPNAPAHEQEIFAIAVRPPDGDPLHVEYHDEHYPETAIQDRVATHGGLRDETMAIIGGGAVAEKMRHWLTGSNPAIDNGKLLGWHAASREHPRPAPSMLNVTTVAARNVEWVKDQSRKG